MSCKSTEDETIESAEVPTSCQGGALAIFNELEPESLATLRKTKKEDLIKFHFSWGMGIRNAYGLWQENSSIRKSCAKEMDQIDMHPDDASMVLMEKVWDLVNDVT